MPELTITSPYVHSRVDSNTFTMGNPMPESTLSPCQGLWIWPHAACIQELLYHVQMEKYVLIIISHLKRPTHETSIIQEELYSGEVE
jgi:hypothetical protein